MVGLWWRQAVAVGMGVVGLLAGAVMIASPAGADEGPHYYLALGGSGSVGLQPTAAFPHGQPTDRGYADDLLDSLRARWNDVTLVQMGCPGATTETMIDGGDRCTYAAGTQLAAAVVLSPCASDDRARDARPRFQRRGALHGASRGRRIVCFPGAAEHPGPAAPDPVHAPERRQSRSSHHRSGSLRSLSRGLSLRTRRRAVRRRRVST